MTRQHRDLLIISFAMIGFSFVAGLIILLPLYGLAIIVGNAYPISEALFADLLFSLVGSLLVFLPLLFRQTVALGADPFRFGPKLIAYFYFPSGLTASEIQKELSASFQRAGKTEDELSFRYLVSNLKSEHLWSPNTRSKQQQRPHKIAIKLLETPYSAGTRAKITITPGVPIPLFNNLGENHTVLKALISDLKWGSYRVPVGSNGTPRWPD